MDESDGQKIRRARIAAGMSQDELGRLLGVTATNIHLIEKNGTVVNYHMPTLTEIFGDIGLSDGVDFGWKSIQQVELPDNPSNGERLRAARTAAGMSQADLAQRLGVKKTAISAMERGVVGVTRHIEKFNSIFGDIGLTPTKTKPGPARSAKPKRPARSSKPRSANPESDGQKIRRARIAAGMSQADLAQRLGVTNTAISTIERGVVGVTRHVEEFNSIFGDIGLTPTKTKPAPSGKQIRAARTALGMSQYQVAERLGVTSQAVSKWETTGTISAQYAERLVRLLKIELAERPTPEPADD